MRDDLAIDSSLAIVVKKIKIMFCLEFRIT